MFIINLPQLKERIKQLDPDIHGLRFRRKSWPEGKFVVCVSPKKYDVVDFHLDKEISETISVKRPLLFKVELLRDKEVHHFKQHNGVNITGMKSIGVFAFSPEGEVATDWEMIKG